MILFWPHFCRLISQFQSKNYLTTYIYKLRSEAMEEARIAPQFRGMMTVLRQYCHPFSDVSGNTYLLFVKGNIG